MNLIRVILHCYPLRCRERYSAEMAVLLESRPPTWRDLGNLALHALDARLNPAMLFVGVPVVERRTVLMHKLRSLEMTIFAAFVAVLVAFLQFSGMFDVGPYSRPNADLIFTQDWTNSLSLIYNLAEISVLVAFGAILIGGLPLVVSIWRRSPRLRGLLLIPVYAFFAALVPPLIILVVAGPHVTVYLSFVTPLTFAYTFWFVAAALLSTAAVTRAIIRSRISDRLTQFTLIPCLVIVVAMITILAVTIAWGPVAHQQAPHVFSATNWDTGFPTWAVDMGVMCIAVIVAFVAAVQGIALGRQSTLSTEPVA